MTLYKVEVRVCATAYIKARSAREAMRKARALKDRTLEVEGVGGDVGISGRQFDDPELPDVSLSPVMTVLGIMPDATAERADD